MSTPPPPPLPLSVNITQTWLHSATIGQLSPRYTVLLRGERRVGTRGIHPSIGQPDAASRGDLTLATALLFPHIGIRELFVDGQAS